jgi:predicted small secreted protein
MRKTTGTLLLVLLTALPSSAGNKVQGAGTLRDFQPAGTTDKKHKHQQFDFFFDASGNQYTCRSSEGAKLKAIDWPVGSQITYEINKNKGKVKNDKGKNVDCTVMRVEPAKATSAENPASPPNPQ